MTDDPDFSLQESLLSDCVGLSCGFCGHVQEWEPGELAELAGCHLGCAECMVVQRVPTLEVMAP
jgi:hypothetical protein